MSVHVVIGSSALGRATAEAALARGHRVRVVSRSGRMPSAPQGVEVVAADAADPAQVTEAAEGADVLHHCAAPAYTDWPAQHPRLLTGLLAAAEATGAVLVNSSNAYMYDPSAGPMVEDGPHTPRSRKGAIRARLDERVAGAHAEGRCRTVTVRAPDFYGPWGTATTVYGDQVFGRVVAGKGPQVFGSLDAVHTWIHVRDFGRAMVTVGDDETAWGRVWHAPCPPPTTQREFLSTVIGRAGVDVRPSAAPDLVVRGLGVVMPVMRELREMSYQWREPYVFTHARFDERYGVDGVVQHERGIDETLAWFRARRA